MLTRLRPRLTFANVVSLLALFIALGGTSYAAIKLPKNSVGPKQIKRSAVTSSEVRNRSLVARDFKLRQLPQGPKGDTGAPGVPGAPGAAGATNVVVRQGPTESCTGGCQAVSVAPCGAGERAVGGGGQGGSGGTPLTVSQPTQAGGQTPTSWTAAAAGTSGATVTARVVCASP